MDDKKITFKNRSPFGCRDMKKSPSVLAFEQFFASEDENRLHQNADISGGSDQAFIASENGDGMHFPSNNMEIPNEFSSTVFSADRVVRSQNLDPNHSKVSGSIDSESLLCVGSPGSGTHPMAQGKAGGASSGSSDEQSDEESSNPIDKKRAKRMVSNRESARRSRKRKQAHLVELEQQVEQLQGENTSLFKQLSDAANQFKEATTNHRVLESDVEALRAKVKLAEAMVACGSFDTNSSHLIQNYANAQQDYMNSNINCVGNVSQPLSAGGDISKSRYTGITESTDAGLRNASNMSDGVAIDPLARMPELWTWDSHAASVSK